MKPRERERERERESKQEPKWSLNLKRIVSVFRRKNPAPTEDSLTLTDEQLKKAKVSSKTLERDILEQKEIRRIETPSGRRAFFRGVAGAVGLKVLAEKIPQTYFGNNYLDYFPETARLINESEGRLTNGIYVAKGGWHCDPTQRYDCCIN